MREDPSPCTPDRLSDRTLHRAMSNHPGALRVVWPRIGTWLHGKGTLSPRLRELATIQAM